MRAPNAILIACLQPWPNRGQRACDRQRSILQQPQRTVGCNCGYESNLYHESNLSLDYVMHLGYKIGQPRSLRACSRDDPECGARRGVPRRAARNCGSPLSRGRTERIISRGRAEKICDYISTTLLTTYRACARRCPASLIEGVF